ncbi:hypothetical protein [Actinosynnema sp. NPDC020468]|uniref:ARPP-2 domain-containing protein n=1 Tax=Actinosynnema sp. NPDC020468 TaxID=3154488 RepID=UPI0033F92AAF
MAFALACHLLFEEPAGSHRPLWTSGRADARLVFPHGVRLVPLVRDEPITALHLDKRVYDGEVGLVELGPRDRYTSCIPHGFVATWTEDGTPAASSGTSLTATDAPPARVPVRVHRRPARRAGQVV